MHKKLFIPGPVEVNAEVLQKFSTPMIGHRTQEYFDLHARVRHQLQQLLFTHDKVFLSTSSGTGVMEGCVRNCVSEHVLNLVCGEFGERWHEIAKLNGKSADALRVDLGKAIRPELVRNALSSKRYDAVTLTHNETSTGVMNPLAEIGAVMKEFPDIIFMVDAVSSMGGAKILVDEWGIDVCLASTQKGFGLPPGFAVFSVSDKALRKAAMVPNRGYYFDFLTFNEYDAKNQTPTTPSLPHIFALDYQLNRWLAEGLERRFARHQQMARVCRQWAIDCGFALFAEPGYESVTLTTVKNTRNIRVGALNTELGKRGYMISAGYGKLKDQTFRIAHTGDITQDDLKELLGVIDALLEQSNVQGSGV
ncbi:MAG: alanine--glyoxylate aminotransferase family protein [Chloroflexi bacterium]|nr:alanine--glyoxylate aminotransferase family protein [Chloroflexota bacterium]